MKNRRKCLESNKEEISIEAKKVEINIEIEKVIVEEVIIKFEVKESNKEETNCWNKK